MFVSNVLNGTVTRIDLTIPKGGNPIVDKRDADRFGILPPNRSGGAGDRADRPGLRRQARHPLRRLDG